MYLNFIDIIILISAAQSLFLSVIIFRKYGKTAANRILAVLMFSYALVLTQMLLVDVRFYEVCLPLVLILISSIFLLGPLHYLYARYIISTDVKILKKDLFHFVPPVIYILIILPDLVKSEGQLPQSMSAMDGNSISVFFLVFNWIVMVQISVYAVMTIVLIRRYSKSIKNLFSSIEKIKLNWLMNIVILFSTGIIIYIIENMLMTWKIISNDYALSSIIGSFYIYIFGYLALLKSEVFASPDFSHEIEQVLELEENNNAEEKKYVKSGLSSDKAAEYENSLLSLMQSERPYLDSEITLNKLAGMMSVSPHHLSEVINKNLNQNFFDFINSYRIEKVKQDLVDSGKQNLTLLAIAIEAGFNSKSSFNMIFKKQTGMTPSEFRKKYLK